MAVLFVGLQCVNTPDVGKTIPQSIKEILKPLN